MYSYKAYGIQFASELLLPELEQSDGTAQPDVTIKIGSVPAVSTALGIEASQNKEKIQCFSATPDTFLLWHKNTAAYRVQDGCRITIDPYMDSTAPDIRLILLGSVFCALLHQRKYLVLHGSSVVIQENGIILTGPSGIGKSTLAGFLQKKHALLTDDVCAVNIAKDGVPCIVPGFPSLKLWKDSAELLGSRTEGLEPVMKNREKFRIGIQNYHTADPVLLHSICVLSVQESDHITIEPVTGMAKLDVLIKNTYRYNYVAAQGLAPQHFKQCTAAASKINIFSIKRPKNGFMINELARAVETNIIEKE